MAAGKTKRGRTGKCSIALPQEYGNCSKAAKRITLRSRLEVVHNCQVGFAVIVEVRGFDLARREPDVDGRSGKAQGTRGSSDRKRYSIRRSATRSRAEDRDRSGARRRDIRGWNICDEFAGINKRRLQWDSIPLHDRGGDEPSSAQGQGQVR